MLREVKKFADKEKIKFIVTGEVSGQRPMSQQKKQVTIIEEESGLKDRIIRPLIDFYGFQGRSRKPQIALAKKFKIKYPSPAGGCLLCEKVLKKRLEALLKRGLSEEEINFVGIGRHFLFPENQGFSVSKTSKNKQEVLDGKIWVVIGRDDRENKIIEASKAGKIIEPDYPAPSAVIMSSSSHRPPPHLHKAKETINTKPTKIKIPLTVINKVNKLIQAYSKRGSLGERKKFDKWKL